MCGGENKVATTKTVFLAHVREVFQQATLNNLAKAKFLTRMDVLKGFHQNVIEEDSRPLLRIILHKGIYEYLRMLFAIGIKNTPSHFQRMMDIEFRTEKWVIIYIDDIIIMSNTWEEHLTRISRILQIVVKMNMKISLKKFKFGFNQIKALGHVVSGIAIGIDQNSMTGLGAALHQVQVIEGLKREGPIVFNSRKLKDSETRYGASQLECTCLVWEVEKLNY
jgi:hypothetical protein